MKLSHYYFIFIIIFSYGIQIVFAQDKSNGNKVEYMEPYEEYDEIYLNNKIIIESGSENDKYSVNYKKTITQDEIKKSGASSAIELLNNQSNISVLNINSKQSSTITMNGSTSSNVLILLDGVKITDPTSPQSSNNISNIPISFIEEIDIIQGSQSVRYGSGASFGIINIKTKKSTQQKNTTNIIFSEEVGTYYTNNTQMGINNRFNNFSIMIFGNLNYSNGYSIASKTLDSTTKLDNDGYGGFDAFFKAGYDFNSTNNMSFLYKKTTARNNYDGYSKIDNGAYESIDAKYYTTLDESITAIQGNVLLFNALYNTISFSKLSNRKNFKDEKEITYYGKEDTLNYLGSIDASDDINIQIGTDLYNHRMTDNENNFGQLYHIFDTAYYAIITEKISNSFSIQEGIRINSRILENSNTRKRNLAYNTGVTYYNNNMDTSFKLNIGHNYRLPSLYETYSLYGYRYLTAEESDNIDLGVVIDNFSNLLSNININVHYGKISDLIVFKNTYENYGDYKSYGINIDTMIPMGGAFNIKPNYSFNKTKKIEDGSQAPNSPKHKLNMDFMLIYSTWNLTLQANYNSKTLDISTGIPEILNDYTLINIILNMEINKEFNWYAKAYNIFNTNYEVFKTQNTGGRAIYFGLNYNKL